MVFEDFSDGSAGWRYFSDRVMGGVSDGGATLETEGDTAFARLTGDVSTANNGGFVQIRRDLTAALPDDSTGLRLTVRGNGETYYVHLRTTQSRRPWQYFAATFPTTDNWQDVTLNWADFTPSGRGFDATLAPADIRSIGIVAYGRDHAADVAVAEITVAMPDP
jgi:hypothetical protein